MSREPIKCDFCVLNHDGRCNMFGMVIDHAKEYACHMDEDEYDIRWDTCCSYINEKIIPRCDNFIEYEIEGKDGLFGKCKKNNLVFYLRWFLGKKICDDHAKPKPKQLTIGSLK